MADGAVPLQPRQGLLIESGGDQAHAGSLHERFAVGGGYPCRFLPTVLQGVEAKVGEACIILAGSPDAEDAALFMELVIPFWIVDCGIWTVGLHWDPLLSASSVSLSADY